MTSSNWNHNLWRTQETWEHVKVCSKMCSSKPRLWESLPDKHLVSLPKKCKEKGERQIGKELLNERNLKPDIKQLKSVDLIWIWFKQANSIENMTFMRHLESCMLNPPANAGDRRDAGLSPGGKTPWRRAWQSTPVFLPGESHGQRSLAGYSS